MCLCHIDDFEVSIFLTETSTRHSLLTKRKHFREKVPAKLQSNSSRLIDETNNEPVDVEAEYAPILLREESDDNINLDTIPAADEAAATNVARRSKRPRGEEALTDSDSDFHPRDDSGDVPAIEINSDDDEEGAGPPPSKRSRRRVTLGDDDAEGGEAEDPDEKKKLAMEISYEGFAIHGLCLCLVVRRREPTIRMPGSNTVKTAPVGTTTNKSGNVEGRPTGHAVMENWITSTQIPAGSEVGEGVGA
jgi:hypothetical protein